jgi:hypothetical protein
MSINQHGPPVMSRERKNVSSCWRPVGLVPAK